MTSASATVEIQDLGPSRWADLESLLARAAGCDGCWCMNHRVAPPQPAPTGAPARDRLRDLVLSGQAYGVLAYRDGRPVGWCALDRLSQIPGHDCYRTSSMLDPERTWSIHCLYVAPDARGAGLSRALLEAAVDLARRHGAHQVEAYPTAPDPQGRWFDFCGPYRYFVDLGFEPIDTRIPPYTIWVRHLAIPGC